MFDQQRKYDELALTQILEPSVFILMPGSHKALTFFWDLQNTTAIEDDNRISLSKKYLANRFVNKYFVFLRIWREVHLVCESEFKTFSQERDCLRGLLPDLVMGNLRNSNAPGEVLVMMKVLLLVIKIQYDGNDLLGGVHGSCFILWNFLEDCRDSVHSNALQPFQ